MLDKPWEPIYIDYMSIFPSTNHRNDCVFLAINWFSKMATIALCKKRITIKSFLNSICACLGSFLATYNHYFKQGQQFP